MHTFRFVVGYMVILLVCFVSARPAISLLMVVYNDFDWIEDVIMLLDPFVSEILIVDGPYQPLVSALNESGLLYDEPHKPTKLSVLISSNSKVRYHYGVWAHEGAKR